jgi:hypothetical protein
VLYPSHLQVAVEESDATLRVRLEGEFDRTAVPLVEGPLTRAGEQLKIVTEPAIQ